MENSAAPSETQSARSAPLRVWPAACLLVAMISLRLTQIFWPTGPDPLPIAGAMGPIIGSGLLLLWWLFASRAGWMERIVAVIGLALAGAITFAASHPSMQGPASMLIWTVPMGMACFALGILCFRSARPFSRTGRAVVLGSLGLFCSILLRSDGMWGHAQMDLFWRWTPSAEEQLLASAPNGNAPTAPSESAEETQTALLNPEWPGFRGPKRDGRQIGTQLTPDWKQSPPQELWRIPVGPAWSSFVVAGNMLFTQEQRGEKECVLCYHADTGEEVWRQEINARFSDPLGGPGPRATPQLAGGSLYVQGADGQLLRLNAQNGSIQWQVNIGKLSQRTAPTWGFSSSPLVVENTVIAFAGGEGDKGVLAFDIDSGTLAWSAAAGDHAYASPHLATIANETLVLMQSNFGLHAYAPSSGKVELAYEWPLNGYRALQPTVTDDGVILLTKVKPYARRLKLSRNDGKLTAEEVWTSRNLKSDFNDCVQHNGSIYGFDGGLFACIDFDTGKRRWKDGRYGSGQVLLLADSGHLLVISERGEGVLLEANPDAHTELGRIQLFEGKTWNHPVVVGDRLYVRNSEEAAAYQLALKAESPSQTTEPAEAGAR